MIARLCQVDYAGRLTAHLPMATRLILVKADGSVSIHADDRAYKPLNWMSPPCTMAERPPDADDTERADRDLGGPRARGGHAADLLAAGPSTTPATSSASTRV